MRYRELSLLIAVVILAAFGARLDAGDLAPTVVASTTWTAAFAEAAGVKDVVTLAPADLRHPAEYELKPSDIALLQKASLVIYGGYEVMAARLVEAAARAKAVTVRIATDYSRETLSASLLAIAERAGTVEEARRNIARLGHFIESWKKELGDMGLRGAPVLVHLFQKPLAAELGFTIKGVFGPSPLEAAAISRLSGEKVVLIIDNWHNEVASPLREILQGARYASLINYPGAEGTVSLLDVLTVNRARLRAAR